MGGGGRFRPPRRHEPVVGVVDVLEVDLPGRGLAGVLAQVLHGFEARAGGFHGESLAKRIAHAGLESLEIVEIPVQSHEDRLPPARDRAVAWNQGLERAAAGQGQEVLQGAPVDLARPVEPGDLDVGEHVGGEEEAPLRQVQAELAVAVAGSVPEHQTPRVEAHEVEAADGEVGPERLEAALPGLAVLPGQAARLAEDALAIAVKLRGEAIVSHALRPGPPGAAEHVVPVGVREDQGHALRRGLAHRPRQLVELGGQHAGIDGHRRRGVEKQDAVHPERPGLAHPDAASQVGPGFRALGRHARPESRDRWSTSLPARSTSSSRAR